MEYLIWDKEPGKPVSVEQIILKEEENLPYWVDMDIVDKERNKKNIFGRKCMLKEWEKRCTGDSIWPVKGIAGPKGAHGALQCGHVGMNTNNNNNKATEK